MLKGWGGDGGLQGSTETPEMSPFMDLRGGLLQGLKQGQKPGVNPFKFGFVGGSDTCNSIPAFEEDNSFGKHVNQEPRPDRWTHISKQGFGKIRSTWHDEAAGYAAVWATAHTRETIWDAVKRRETSGTSCTRLTERFFGGWTFAPEDARRRGHLSGASIAWLRSPSLACRRSPPPSPPSPSCWRWGALWPPRGWAVSCGLCP
jgi:hypothetical protein